MEFELSVILALTLVSFIAGFIDSIAGGGGLIMLPSYLLAGLPPHYTLGTNKFVGTLGTGVAVVNFIRKGKLSVKIVISGITTALLGAYIGSRLILLFDANLVGQVIVFLLPIGIVLTLVPKKKIVVKESLKSKDLFIKIPLICLIVGFYDGFFGPGTGAFLALAFNVFLRLNLVEATAHAKVFNFISNLGALVAFVFSGKVYYLLALPLVASGMLGNYLGSNLAIKKGDKFIKFFLLIVIVILIVTLITKYF